MSLVDSYVKTEYTEAQKAQNREDEMKTAFLEESGLEGADADYLRRQFLSAEEATAAKTEQMEDIRARKSRKPDWDEYVDARRRWGKALHHSEIIRRLHRLIPNLFVMDGTVKNTLGLYIWDGQQRFGSHFGGTVFLGWLHVGWNPEYEIDFTDDVGVALRQKRGWRTTLMRMICRRDATTFYPRSLFSEADALREFGMPTQGNTASNFRKTLYEFRNTSPDRARMNHQIMEAAQRYRYA